ncbi:MAG: hypothetical protein CMM50_18335 [Rhodospirillaceae bacterium]|nr:hypothetical protein [Rhodospirillaceae bacterium]
MSIMSYHVQAVSEATVQTAFGDSAAVRHFPVARFAIDADAECSVMPRVLEQFASLGLIPSHWESTVEGDTLHIELSMTDMDAARAEYLARRLRRIFPVRAVVTAV